MKGISRRNFLRYLGAGSLGFLAKPLFGLPPRERQGRASDVIQCIDDNATTGNSVNTSVAQIMIDESVKVLTGISDLGEAWKSIFPGVTENSIIGIKVNTINNAVPTRPELVDCIINGLAQMQFGSNFLPRNNVIIWDRSDGELSSAGFTIYDGNDPGTPRCFGTNHSGVGYDSGCPLSVPGGPVYPSRILSLLCDYLINFGVLKNHGTAQVTFSLKNHYGSTSPVPSHASYCNPGIPAVNQQIRDVITPNDIQKLFIIDSLWASVLYGPGGNPDWNPKTIVMSQDTVACDYQSWNLINEVRVNSGYTAIPWPIYHIETAEQSPYNLGTTDINLIEIINPSQGIEEEKGQSFERLSLTIAPNPFRKQAMISFVLPMAAMVKLELIDAAGRIAEKLHVGKLSAGRHRFSHTINGSLPAGTYFLRLSAGNTSCKRKVILLR
jgi:hypothetical protein